MSLFVWIKFINDNDHVDSIGVSCDVNFFNYQIHNLEKTRAQPY